MKRHKFTHAAASLSATLLVGAVSPLLGGIQHVQAPPPKGGVPMPPPRGCDGCVDPGFYLSGSVLFLRSFNAEENDYRGEWDVGFRGLLGWASPSGLQLELTGFYHDTDFESDLGAAVGSHEFYYLDFTVGDTIQCGELCLSFAGGLRYGGNEFDEDRGGVIDGSEFKGVGPVVAIGATRSLTERLSLYATLRQSLLFGEDEYKDGNGGEWQTDTLTAITEIGAGLQANFGLGAFDAFIRAGMEGQYWFEDGGNIGLFGGALSVGAHF